MFGFFLFVVFFIKGFRRIEQEGYEMSRRSTEQLLFGLLASLMCAQACFAFGMRFFCSRADAEKVRKNLCGVPC